MFVTVLSIGVKYTTSQTIEVKGISDENKPAAQVSTGINGSINKPTLRKVVVANIMYNMLSETPLKVIDAQTHNGYTPASVDFEDSYTIELVSADASVLERSYFLVPNRVSEGAADVILKTVSFPVTVRWHEKARKIILRDQFDNLVSTFDTTNVKHINKTTQYKTLSLDTKNRPTNMNVNDDIDPTSEKVDVVFIGDDFVTPTEQEYFQNLINEYAQHLSIYDPIRSRIENFRFHIINNTEDLNCGSHPDWGEFLYCDNAKAFNIATNSGVSIDKLIIIYNNIDYYRPNAGLGPLGSMHPCCVRMSVNSGAPIFVHELGHLLGNLNDEYTFDIYDSTIDNTIDKNCFKGNPTSQPPSAWQGIVGAYDYYQGCKNPNWYRTSNESSMNGNSPFFNKVSQKILNDHIDLYTGPLIDTQPPTGELLKPVTNSAATYTIPFEFEVSDDKSVAYLQVWRDGEFVYTYYIKNNLNKFLYSVRDESVGTHNYQLKAFDAYGNVWESDQVQINILSKNDIIPPIPSLLEPAPNSNVAGVTEIRANATDDSGYVSEVRFFVDGELLGVDSIAPYSLNWDASEYSLGKHRLKIGAYDLNANYAETASVSVNVARSVDRIPPEVLIDKPLNNSVIPMQRDFKIIAFATDNIKVKQIKIMVNNKLVYGCKNMKVCKATVKVATLSTGNNIIRVEAYDLARNVGSANINVVRQN